MVKSILALGFAVLIVLGVVYRQREYVRDPLAKVYRNGVAEDNVEVFQNWNNDILLEEDRGATRILLQEWDQMPGTPTALTCIQAVACLTAADHAPTIPLVWTGKGKYDPKVVMTNLEVSFVDGTGAEVRIDLR